LINEIVHRGRCNSGQLGRPRAPADRDGETSEAVVDLHPATIEPYRHLVADLRAAVSGDVSRPAGRILELIWMAQTKNAAQNGRRTM
jgi:hypothetical protein